MAQPPRPSNIDRALVQAPNDFLSIEEEDLAQQEDDFLNVEVVENDEGAEVSFGEEEVTFGGEPENFYDNLASMVSDATLTGVASYVIDSVEEDRTSRDDWEDTYVKGLDLLGMRYESRTEPFDGATGVIHPLLNEAVTQFQSQAYKEMLPSSGPVRANIVGTPTPDAEQQAQRVQDYMNYQIMYEMEEYEPEFDQMLYYLGLAGSAFKKVYRDQALDRPVSKFIPAEDVLVPYVATDLKTAERVTHVIKMSKNELRKAQVSGVYLDMEGKGGTTDSYGGGSDSITDAYDDIEGRSPSGTDEQFTLYECHCFLDLDDYPDVDAKGEETGIKLPYIVTVCLDTNDICRAPAGALQISSSNMPAGFKARGLRIADEANPLAPGEFRDVDVPGGDLKASLMPLPYKEPSGTLFSLMGFVVEAAQRFIGTTDMGMGQGNQEMPVGTTIALLERGSRIVSAVHKRLHSSMKSELRMLARLFAEDPTPYPYNVGVDGMIKMQDFDNRVDILPVSDPNIFSMSQRVVLAQEQLKLAQSAPDLHNLYESYKRVYEALGVSNIEQILNPEPEPQPMDPSTENQEASKAAAGQGKMQAFPQQDHDAHIAVHSAYMNSKVAQMQPPLLMTLEKHIYEHLGMKAMVMAQQQMQGQQVDPAQVAQLQAQLIAEYQKSQPPAQEQDPLVRIKEKELQLRQQEMIADQQNDQQKLALDQQRAQQNFQLGQDRIDSTEDIAQMRARIALQKQNQTRG